MPSKKKILIIEDERIIIELLAKKLIASGYEVVMARDGEEGLEKIDQEKPDLVLLDIVLPKMDGMEVLKKAKSNEATRDIPVVIISNSGQPVELDKAKRLGANDWLVKTEFDPVEVIQKVKENV